MTYVMSDIHGNLTAFNEILDEIQFSVEDTLYILGDAIRRLISQTFLCDLYSLNIIGTGHHN